MKGQHNTMTTHNKTTTISTENNGHAGARCFGGVHGGTFNGFAKAPPLVPTKQDGGNVVMLPRKIPSRLYMNRRGQWVLP